MQEETLFDLVVDKSPVQRQEILDRMCQDNQALRQRIEALLAAHDKADPKIKLDFDNRETFAKSPNVSSSAPDSPARDSTRSNESVDSVILGRYKLLQQIGEGGMGTVWMADQLRPVRRRVAVKLIRTEKGTSKQILARFEAERQAIAVMDHPNIAKLLDAGTSENGSPFFVMELVKGIPLTEYCD